MEEFRQCLTQLSARDTIMAGYYSLMFLLLLLFIFSNLQAGGHTDFGADPLALALVLALA